MAKKEVAPVTLCHRCEHRVRFFERGHAPRYECGDTKKAVCGCYMYCPVMPVALERNKGDRRPMGGITFLSARAHGVPLPDGYEWVLKAKQIGKVLVKIPAIKKLRKRTGVRSVCGLVR